MSLAAEKAAAARALAARGRKLRIPDQDLAELWGEFTEAIEETRSEGAAILAGVEWRRTLDERLARPHSPARRAARGT